MSDLKQIVRQVFKKNETTNPYEISHPPTANSGYSFGQCQWDLSKNAEARELFKDIVRYAEEVGNKIFSPTEIDELANSVGDSVLKDPNSPLIKKYKDKINQALQAESLRIDTAYAKRLTDIETRVNQVIAQAKPEYQAFLNTDLAKTFLADYHNQFNIASDGEMERFLKGDEVPLGSGKEVQVEGEIGVSDLLKFYFSTKHALGPNGDLNGGSPGDLLRRFSNVLETLKENNIEFTLTAEDAGFLVGDGKNDLVSLLGGWENYLKLVFDKNKDNIGMRELFARAVTVAQANGWRTAYARWLEKDYMEALKNNYEGAKSAMVFPRRDPLIVDLDGDGVETINLKSGAHFDHDGNRFAEETGWASGDDGLLVMDRNGDGLVNDGKELFGDQTILRNGTKAANGFQALVELDENGDGKIDATDSAYSQLRLWKDWDEDGYSLAEELYTLDEVGIQSIGVNSTITNVADSEGNTHTRSGSFERGDGSTGVIDNVSLRRDTTYRLEQEHLDVPAEIALLPDAQGYGNVLDLHQALVKDTSGQLKSFLEAFALAADPANREQLVEQILFKWTGSAGISPDSRGPNIDARKLAVVEGFMGERFSGQGGSNPTREAAVILDRAYRMLYEMYYGQLMAQTHLKSLFEKITYSFEGEAFEARADLSAAVIDLQVGLSGNPEEGRQLLGGFSRALRGIGATEVFDYVAFRETFIRQDPSLAWVIDTGGLPVYDWSGPGPDGGHRMGTNSTEALKGGLIQGDGVLNGLSGDDVIYGTSRDELLINEIGDAVLVGEGGDDTLWAGSGDDLLDGGEGNDRLVGETGNDTYLFRRGYGHDTIYDVDSNLNNTDRIRFGDNISPEQVIIKRLGNNLDLSIQGTSDRLTIEDYFRNDSSLNRIERIEFADGTVWGTGEIYFKTVIPTEGDDFLYGWEVADFLRGLGGNDFIYGRGGDDILQGDAGNDWILGDAGNDLLEGGEGRDTLTGGEGDDFLVGGAGNDELSGKSGNDTLEGDEGEDNLFGDEGNDILNGGPGNDTLYGGSGNDTYVFTHGSGQDKIFEEQATLGNTDTVNLGDGIRPSDVILRRDGVNLVLSFTGRDDKLIIGSAFHDETEDFKIERIQFADGTTWGTTDIKTLLLQPTAGDDILIGFPVSESIRGLDGNDRLFGQGGDDVLQGDSGNDALYGGPGDDTLDGGAGNDELSGGMGNDTYLFGSGSGQDEVFDSDATPGNMDTVLISSDVQPSDLLVRRLNGDMYGSDDLVLTIAGGSDRLDIQGWFWNESSEYQVENIQFADGTLWDVSDLRTLALEPTSGNDVLIGYSTEDNVRGLDGDDQLYGREGDDFLYGDAGNDRLFGETGDDTLAGDLGDDFLRGSFGNDVLMAGEGDDQLLGDIGDDTLDGGPGADTLYGGSGNDSYVFMPGSGDDTIYEWSEPGVNFDTIHIGGDAQPADVAIRREGYDVVLSFANWADKLTVWGWCYESTTGDHKIDQIQFENETVWGVLDIKAALLQGTPDGDLLIGFSTEDFMEGFEANDTLYGGAGNDTLDGGEGNDLLFGEEGSDTYLFGRGSGQDVIIDTVLNPQNADAILLADDLVPSDILARRKGDDLTFLIKDTTDTVTVQKWFQNETITSQVKEIRFADGTAWDVGAIKQMVLQGTPDKDLLIGYSTHDILDGGPGNDRLYGKSGNDIYVFGRGYGQDEVIDEDQTPGNVDNVALAEDVSPEDVTLKRAGNHLHLLINGTDDSLTLSNWFKDDASKIERVQFSDGTVWDTTAMEQLANTPTDTDDYIEGTPENDVIDAGGGDDYVRGLEGDDTLYGGTGFDYLEGESGDDTLQGGQDDDTIYGGYGDDTLYGGPGYDYLYGDADDDKLYGGEGDDELASGYGVNELDGGAGNDRLDGTKGDNTYHIQRGGGFDFIKVRASSAIVEGDTIVFGEGITPQDLSVQISGGAAGGGYGGYPYGGSSSYGGKAQIAIGIGEDEGVLIEGSASSSYGGYGGWSYGGSAKLGDLAVKRFVFADGTVLTLEEILARADEGVIGEQEGTYGDDFLRGSVADDEIYGDDGDDRIEGRDNNDLVFADYGNDAVSGGSGQDEVYGGYGDDVLAGGKGDDQVSDWQGNDVYAFNRGDGSDWIDAHRDPESDDVDVLSFGTSIRPEDVRGFVDTYGYLVLSIEGSSDQITTSWFDPYNNNAPYEEQALSRAQFIESDGSGRVFDLAGIISELKDSLLAATAEAPIALFTQQTAGHELLDEPLAGGDYALAYAQTGDLFAVPTYYYNGDEDDFITGRAGDDTIDAGDGDNVINAGEGDNSVTTGSGDDTITAGGGEDLIQAGDGDNAIFAGAGNDLITSGTGFDVVEAGEGNDDLATGPGNDLLYGGAGDDTYYFNLGDGTLTINDIADTSGGNRIVFGENITPDDLTLKADGSTLVIEIGTEEDNIRLNNFVPAGAYGPHAVELYQFNDASILTYSQLLDKGFDLTGTLTDDDLTGTSVRDRITGLGGDDRLTGGGENDLLDGGSGHDTYVFNMGDGIDTIRDEAYGQYGNVIQFGSSITPSDITLSFDQNGLFVQVGNEGDGIRFEDFDPANANGPHPVETFSFADGLTFSFSELLELGFTINGTSGEDDLRGTSVDDVFNGMAGNDLLRGGAADDTYLLRKGDGIDTIEDQASLMEPNTLLFGPGIAPDDIRLGHDPVSKTLIMRTGKPEDEVRLAGFDATDPYGSHAIEYFQFAGGPILTYSQLIDLGFDIDGGAGDDTLIGTAASDHITGKEGADTLQGNAGNDTLSGGAGDDTYLFNLGDGVDAIEDVATASEGNTLVFGEGITLEGLRNRLTFQDNTLIIRTGDQGDEVHLTGFDQDAADIGPRAVQSFRFNDGTLVNYEALVQNTFVIQGDTGDDPLTGSNLTDRLYGYEGFDRLEGGLGDDTLTGGTGDDDLLGGEGNETYVFNLGDGVDTIHDTATVREGNLILFGEGISRDDLSISRIGNVLTIHVGTLGDAIHLQGFDESGENGSLVARSIEFADGSRMQTLELLGTEGDDVITTGQGDDAVDGRGGNDLISTGDGWDTLTGGTGNDTLMGGAHNDTYVFNPGDGVDTITDTVLPGEGNRIRFGDTIAPDDLTFSYEGTTLRINVGTGGDGILLRDFDPTNSKVVETLVFENGTEIPIEALLVPKTRDYDLSMEEDGSLAGAIEVENPQFGITFSIKEGSANGEFAINPDGAWGYRPNENYNGSDQVLVEVTNQWGKSALCTINLTILPVNDFPVAEDLPVPVGLQDIREVSGQVTATDVDGDTLTYGVSEGPQHGSFTIGGDGAWTYQAQDLYMGPDQALVTVDDGKGGVVFTSLNFDVKVSAPGVQDITLSLLEDGSISQKLTVVNPVGGEVLYSITQSPANGTFLIQEDGHLTYTPAANYNGSDQAIVTVTNAYGLSTSAAIGLTVQPVNDVPLVKESESFILFGVPSLAGQIKATDVDKDEVSYRVIKGPGNGTFTIDGEGRWIFSPNRGYTGEEQTVITVEDGKGGIASTTLNFLVNVYEGGDQVVRGDSTDSIRLKDISKDELELTRQEANLRIDIRGKGSLTLEGYFATPENGVDRLETVEGPLHLGKDVIKEAQAMRWSWRPWGQIARNTYGENGLRNLIFGSDADDQLFGANVGDVLFGGRGNDSLKGKDGNDTLVGGDGHDMVWGTDGHDTLYGDKGSDTLFGGEGDDALIGGADCDYLNGDGGNDRLFGDGGNDVLTAGTGRDTLSGGEGNDFLLGGAGDDTYRFKPGDGRDVVKDSLELWHGQKRIAGNDTVQFGQGVSREDVALFMKWGKLFLQYGETDLVEVYNQQWAQDKIERFELADGSYLTDADVNRVIQEMSSYAVNEGICLQSVEDVRRSDELMTLIAGSWKQG